jgi:hypothetical protein
VGAHANWATADVTAHTYWCAWTATSAGLQLKLKWQSVRIIIIIRL